MPENQDRPSKFEIATLAIAITVVVLVIVAALVAPKREMAVETLNRRGDFEVISYRDTTPHGSVLITAGRIYSWDDRFQIAKPFRLQNPRWVGRPEANRIGTSEFLKGVFYHAELHGDTIVLVGK